jgi:hypothetical protein
MPVATGVEQARDYAKQGNAGDQTGKKLFYG